MNPASIDADTIHSFTMKNIDGKEVPLSTYKGKVLLVVNVASKCGLTPQYAKLQAVYEKYQGKGFEVLGFPANNFRGQEPGTDAQIKEFCTGKYNVSFPMFSKISVLGDTTHPLYQWLLANSAKKDSIEWNFAKFLVGKDGKVIARFSSRTAPDAAEVTSAIEKALS